MVSLLELVLIGLLGIIISTFGVIGGLSGAVILIPMLHFIFGIPLKVTVGTVLLSFFLPGTIATIGAVRRKEVDFRLGIIFQIPASLGSIIGALFVVIVPSIFIQVLFGILSLLLSYRMFRHWQEIANGIEKVPSAFWEWTGRIGPHLRAEREKYSYTISIPVLICFGFIIGFISGMLGIGAGWLQSPLLILGFGVPPLIASSTSLFITTAKSLTGGVVHLLNGNVDLQIFLTLTISLPIGVLIGNHLRWHVKDHHVSLVIGIILILVAITMLGSAILLMVP